MKIKLDDLDQSILSELDRDARLTPTLLSRVLDVPRTTIKSRIDRMIEVGLITGFSVNKDYGKLGLPTTAFILISYDSSRGVTENDVAKELYKIHNVEEVHIISGEYDILVKIRGESIEDVGESVVDSMHQIPGVARTLTLSSFREIR